MILDKELQYSDSQEITGTVDSTNILDHGVDKTGLGAGEPFVVLIAVSEVTTQGNVSIDLESDNADDFSGTVVDIGELTILSADLVAGSRFYLPVNVGYKAKRYTRLEYTAGSADFVADCYLIPQSHQDAYESFPDNTTIAG